MAELRCCMAETNTTLESNCPPIKKNIKKNADNSSVYKVGRKKTTENNPTAPPTVTGCYVNNYKKQ